VRAVVQRVSSASVKVDGQIVGRCGRGLLLLVAAHRDDTKREAAKMADKVANLRIFNDAEGKMNLSLRDLEAADEAQVLAISNFTVYGETAKNRRPSFMQSAPYDRGNELYEALLKELRGQELRVEAGIFGADMKVELINDGPVTVILDVPPISAGPR
jgi:D-aminoacyl-tRNA deacylase